MKNLRKVESLSFFGLFLIVFSIFFLDEKSPFPSSYTLIPVSGVVLIILFSDNSTFVGRLLKTHFLVFAGLLSYSAYLWHQPILAYARLFTASDQLNIFLQLFCITLTFTFAYLTYSYIETPFRVKGRVSNFSNKSVLIIASACTISFLGLTLFGLEKLPKPSWNDISGSMDVKLDVNEIEGEAAFAKLGIKQISERSRAKISFKQHQVSDCKILILGILTRACLKVVSVIT